MANNYIVNSSDLTSVADAIRDKAGTSDPLVFPDGFVEAVEGISGGGGNTDAEDGIITRTIIECSNDRVTSVGEYAFYGCSQLASVDFPNAKSIGSYTFYGCSKLTSINFPNVTSMGSRAFYQCSSLASANFPNAKSIESYAFNYCSQLASIDFPSATSIGTNAFYQCTKLTNATFSDKITIGQNAFASCYQLKALILRSEAICPLSNKNAFDYCYHILGTVNNVHNPDGLKDGYFYVPKALLSDDDETKDYHRATNWSTYADRFRALEDYTIDGTITGEIDWDKLNTDREGAFA